MKKVIPFAAQSIRRESNDPVSFGDFGPLSNVKLDFELASVENDSSYLGKQYCNFCLLKIDILWPLIDGGLAEIAKMLAGEYEEQSLIEVDATIILFLYDGKEVF